MSDEAVELRVAGQKCRVVTTADEEELDVLASMVEEKLEEILTPGRPVTTQAMVLAAVALAHDVRAERERADAIAETARNKIRFALDRVEQVLAESDERSKLARKSHHSQRRDDGAPRAEEGSDRQPASATPTKRKAAKGGATAQGASKRSSDGTSAAKRGSSAARTGRRGGSKRGGGPTSARRGPSRDEGPPKGPRDDDDR